MQGDKDIGPGSPADWLRHAQGDLALAKAPLPEGGLYATLCFHAQQAAEKSIKAVLLALCVEFPKVHSLSRLIDLLPADVPRPDDLKQSARLTVYATIYRYPAAGDDLDVPIEHYREAIRLAEFVFRWASSQIPASKH